MIRHRAFRSLWCVVAATCLLVGLASVSSVTSQPADADRFLDIAFLLGEWDGRSEGQPGDGTVQRQYERVLGGQFIRVQNTSTYAPQPKNPKGEVHQDVGFFSLDRERKRLVLRQFHVEGFVNQYVQQETLVFISEAIENIPAGWRARESYRVIGPDAFEETFELAEPGKDWNLYSRTRFTRVRR